jgi:hypothetical protein
MANPIKVNVDVDSGAVTFATEKVLTLTQQVRALRFALQTIPEGTKEWSVAQKVFVETKANLERVTVKSKELFGTLGTLPGQFGNIAGQADSTISVLKTFSRISVKDLKAQFIELGNDFVNIGKNLLVLTGISTVYTTVVETMTVAEGEASIATKVLAGSVATLYAALGAGLLIALGFLVNYLIDLASNAYSGKKEMDDLTKSIASQQTTLEEYNTAIEANAKANETKAKIAGATEADIAKIEQQSYADRIRNLSNTNLNLLAYYIKHKNDRIYQTEEGKKKLKELEDQINKNSVDQTKLTNQQNQAALDDQLAITKKAFQNRLATIDIQNKRELALIALDKAKLLSDLTLTEDKKIFIEEQSAILSLESTKRALQRRQAQLKSGGADYVLEAQVVGNEILNIDSQIQQARNAGDQQTLDFKRKINDKVLDSYKQLRDKRLEVVDSEERSVLAGLGVAHAQGLLNNIGYEEQKSQVALKYAKQRTDIALASEKNQLANLETAYTNGIYTYQEYQDKKIKILEDFNKTRTEGDKVQDELDISSAQRLRDVQKQFTDDTLAYTNAGIEAWSNYGNSVASALSSVASMLEEGSDAQKIFAILSVLISSAAAVGNVIVQTNSAIASLMKSGADGLAAQASGTAMLPLNPILGAALLTSGTAAIAASTAGIAAAKIGEGLSIGAIGLGAAAQIAAITSKGKSNVSSSGGGSTGGSASTPAFNMPSIGAPQIGASNAQTGVIAGTVAGAIGANNSTMQPLKAYVVGNDITTEMQLQRRLRTMARLGG